jgi:hypothetical protein
LCFVNKNAEIKADSCVIPSRTSVSLWEIFITI